MFELEVLEGEEDAIVFGIPSTFLVLRSISTNLLSSINKICYEITLKEVNIDYIFFGSVHLTM